MWVSTAKRFGGEHTHTTGRPRTIRGAGRVMKHERVMDLETQGAVAHKKGTGRSAQPDDYDRWNQWVRLQSLRDEAQLTAAIAVLDELLAQGQLSAAADAYLGA